MSEFELFARTYDLEFGTLTEDIPFWLELAKETGGPALEFAVGTGRVAIPIARAGIPTVGIDVSPGMLGHLHAKLAREPGLPLAAVEGDMRTVDVRDRGPFGLVYSPGRALQGMLTLEDQLAAFGNARRHLRSGGLFAGSLFFPDVKYLAMGRRPWTPADGFTDPETGRRSLVSESTIYDLRAQRLLARFRVEEFGEDGEVVRTELRELALSWIWPRELDHLLVRAGFTPKRLYGDFRRTPFAEGGTEIVFVARA
jgi:SAM-dependent methyltransferase